ncbi:MAG TPA: nucleoside triphosphate pyrophosphohydrolase [Candidatus Saccharimonadaceae bacterium]|nr:nucleoside triphosphate pyrophosphohydrolase [Candidatus Saccharimonadaceae bacterium]
MKGFTHTVTDLDIENEYPKLVRDRIPEIIMMEDGRKVPVKILNDAEFERRLRQKAIEEATELAEAETDEHLLEEIADVREILDELERFKGFSAEQVKKVQDQKRARRGGFHKRVLMLRND